MGRSWARSAITNIPPATAPPIKPVIALAEVQPCACPLISPQVNPNIDAVKSRIPAGSSRRASASRDSVMNSAGATPRSAQNGTDPHVDVEGPPPSDRIGDHATDDRCEDHGQAHQAAPDCPGTVAFSLAVEAVSD